MMRILVVLFVLVVTDNITASGFAIQPYAINFDQVPLSQTVVAGANVSFSCSAAIDNKSALPQFIWYCNNTELTNGNISYTGINMSTLFIFNVTEADQGEYYCIVKDWETRTKSSSGKLIVYRQNSIIKSEQLNITSNGTIILQCKFDGIKLGMIQWFRNGVHIDFTNKRFHHLQDGSLVMLHVNSSDDGEYLCEATVNAGGCVKLKSYKLLTVSMDSDQINDVVSLYPENSTHFIENMTIVCNIPSSLAVYNITWTRNGTAIGLSAEYVEVVEYNLLKIIGMDVVSNEYRCMVYKSSSDKSPTISSPLVIYKHSAPVVEHSDITDHFICANSKSSANFSCVNGTVQTVDLYCNSVGGYPIPTVTWYHNGNEIINANASNGTMTLNNTACDLLGTYQCIVSNEVGSEIITFRILPFGWPNPPSMPKLSVKGRMLYVYWNSPEYLGGLNSSLINYEILKQNHYNKTSNLFNNKKYDCSSVDNHCNKTFLYNDLRFAEEEEEEHYYITLNIDQSTNMMCLSSNISHTITSMKSSIALSNVVEYGPPLVNLTCSDEGYVDMTSLPTGSLSSKELWDNRFVSDCSANFTCINSRGMTYSESTIYCEKHHFKIPWRSFNCSVDVLYDYRNNYSAITSKYCLSSNYTIESNLNIAVNENTSMIVPTTASAITSLVQTVSATIQPIILSKVPPPSSLLPSNSSKEDPSSSTRESSLVVAFTSLSVTTNQATPISSFVPISTESSSVGPSIAAIALSSVIALVVVIFIAIFIGLFYCKRKREQQIHKFHATEREFQNSLDSIPKAYSYIGREDQSVCEKPNVKVANWITGNGLDHDESKETTSINSDDLSNEQMLDVLYGADVFKTNDDEISIDVDTIHGGCGSFISEETASIISSSLLTDYMCEFTTHMNCDDLSADSINCSSNFPIHMAMTDYAKIVDYQKASSKNTKGKVQNDPPSHGNSLISIDHVPGSNPDKQKLPKDAVESQDTRPYVSLSNNSKKCPAVVDASDHGEYIEYDDITPRRAITGQNHSTSS